MFVDAKSSRSFFFLYHVTRLAFPSDIFRDCRTVQCVYFYNVCSVVKWFIILRLADCWVLILEQSDSGRTAWTK